MQSHDEVLEVIDNFNTYIWGKGGERKDGNEVHIL